MARKHDIPKSVKILSQNYAVIKKNMRKREGKNMFGEIDYFTNEIFINSSMTHSQQWLTLIHEVLHGYEEELTVTLKEKDVDLISKIVTCFLIDNGFLKVKKHEKQDIEPKKTNIKSKTLIVNRG